MIFEVANQREIHTYLCECTKHKYVFGIFPLCYYKILFSMIESGILLSIYRFIWKKRKGDFHPYG